MALKRDHKADEDRKSPFINHPCQDQCGRNKCARARRHSAAMKDRSSRGSDAIERLERLKQLQMHLRMKRGHTSHAEWGFSGPFSGPEKSGPGQSGKESSSSVRSRGRSPERQSLAATPHLGRQRVRLPAKSASLFSRIMPPESAPTLNDFTQLDATRASVPSLPHRALPMDTMQKCSICKPLGLSGMAGGVPCRCIPVLTPLLSNVLRLPPMQRVRPTTRSGVWPLLSATGLRYSASRGGGRDRQSHDHPMVHPKPAYLQPQTLNPKLGTLSPEPYTPTPRTLSHKSRTLKLKPWNPNPKP